MLEPYDTSRLLWIRINHGSRNYEGVYGRCHLPTRSRPTYRISCQLPGPFPCDIMTRKPPLYPRSDGSFARTPRGCRRTRRCFDRRTGRSWMRVIGSTRVMDLDEALVWIFSHEAYHFLRLSRQIQGRHSEIEADRYADRQLEAFRASG
jgi:hypothetical protein